MAKKLDTQRVLSSIAACALMVAPFSATAQQPGQQAPRQSPMAALLNPTSAATAPSEAATSAAGASYGAPTAALAPVTVAADGRVNYGVLDPAADYMRYAQPQAGYQPTPLYGPLYDRTQQAFQVDPQIQPIIQNAISRSNGIDIGGATIDSNLVRNIYKLRNYNPVFVTSQGATMASVTAKDILTSKVILMGLDPNDYWSNEMESRLNSKDLNQLAALDVLLTQSMIQLATDLNTGRTAPQMVDTHTLYVKRPFSDYVALNNAFRPGADLFGSLQSLAPQHSEYKNLEAALAHFYEVRANGGWPKVSGRKMLNPGAVSNDIPLIRARFVEMGLLPQDGNASSLYDPNMVAAAKVFQKNHKAKQDGVLGPAVYNILNTSVDERIGQVRANMDKWRALPRQLGDRYIMVNLARQELQVIEFGQVVLKMDTINGKLLKPTPVMTDKMSSVVLNPYWNPPPNNIRELMKSQRENPNTIVEHHIKLTRGATEIDPATVPWKSYVNTLPPFSFREEPGPLNSLGVVKFNLGNAQSIYLHDTNVSHDPNQVWLWDKDDRTISSGCVRVREPLKLLQYVLRDQPNYDATRLDSLLAYPNQNAARTVMLTKPIPVYLMYGTVSFSEDGKLRFTKDIYGQDARILRAMTPLDNKL